jgi:hypothetical protein
MPSLWPTLARQPREFPDSARSSKTIATARSRNSAGAGRADRCDSLPRLLPDLVIIDSSARLLNQFLPCSPGDGLAVEEQRLHARPGKLQGPCRIRRSDLDLTLTWKNKTKMQDFCSS